MPRGGCHCNAFRLSCVCARGPIIRCVFIDYVVACEEGGVMFAHGLGDGEDVGLGLGRAALAEVEVADARVAARDLGEGHLCALRRRRRAEVVLRGLGQERPKASAMPQRNDFAKTQPAAERRSRREL